MFSQGYLIDVQLCIAALWLFYALALHRRIPLAAARSYLLGLFPVGVLLPLLRIPLLPARKVAETIWIETAVFPMPEVATLPEVVAQSPIDWGCWLAVLYGAGVVLFLTFQTVGLLRVWRQISHTRAGEVLFSTETAGAYSVFGRIFVDSKWKQSPLLESILAHERSHISHGHSFDLLWMNLWRAVLWYHPAAWHCGRMIREIHEFQADRAVIRQGNAIGSYIDLLIDTEAGIYPGTANALCYSLTKKRLDMMTTQSRGRRLGGYLRLAALPFVGGALLCAFSLTAKAADPAPSLPQSAETVLPAADTLSIVFNDPVKVHYLDGEKITIQSPEIDTLRELFAEAQTVIKNGQILKSKTLQKQSTEAVTKQPVSTRKDTIAVQSKSTADTSKVPPIYIIDGVECAKPESIDDLTIQSITILKGETAIRAYGERARGEAILIKTKSESDTTASKLKQTITVTTAQESASDSHSGRYAARTVSAAEVDKIKMNNISVLSSSEDGAPALALSPGRLITNILTNRQNGKQYPTTSYKNGTVTVYLSKKEQEDGITVASKLLNDCPEHFYLDTENNWVRNREPVAVTLYREQSNKPTTTYDKNKPGVVTIQADNLTEAMNNPELFTKEKIGNAAYRYSNRVPMAINWQ